MYHRKFVNDNGEQLRGDRARIMNDYIKNRPKL